MGHGGKIHLLPVSAGPDSLSPESVSLPVDCEDKKKAKYVINKQIMFQFPIQKRDCRIEEVEVTCFSVCFYKAQLITVNSTINKTDFKKLDMVYQ